MGDLAIVRLDRGEPIDAGMLAFTIGEDWRMDQRLVAHDITGSLAHAAGLLEAGLIDEDAWAFCWVVDAPLFEPAGDATAAA